MPTLIIFFILFFISQSLAHSEDRLIAEGKKVYLAYGCAVCHGKEGWGDGPNAKQFYPPATDFTNLNSYQRDPGKDAMRGAIRNGINEEKSIMPAFKDIPDKDVEALLVYLISLQEKIHEVNMKRIILAVAVLLILPMSLVHSRETKNEEAITVTHAWVRVLPPTQPHTAGYMKIRNDSKEERILLSAQSSSAEVVELHQMVRSKGMMSMNKVEEIIIPAQKTVELSSNGYHVMLINLKKRIKKGDTIPILLHFDRGLDVTVEAIAGESVATSCCVVKKTK